MVKISIKEKKFNFFNSLSPRKSTNRIILHHTGGADIDASAEQIHQWHLENGWAGIGYHFVIRKDGTIERGRPLNTIGSHAYGANADSIGIHLSGDFSFVQPTDPQIESAAALIANLCFDFNIPINRNYILGHREVGATDCPGNLLFALLPVIVNKANWFKLQNADVVDFPVNPKKIIFKPRAGLLSEHFAESEFACRCCGDVEVDARLIELLEFLRYNIGGYPLYINSGYRCSHHNSEIGGAVNSYHTHGKAADVARPRQLNFGEFKWYVEQLPFDGIGIYRKADFIHVDVRNGGVGSKIFWEG